MPFNFQNFGAQVGAPMPTQSLMGGGGGDILGALRNMMGAGQQPQMQQMQQPGGGAGGAEVIKTELANQMAVDPVAQQHAGDPTYEQMLKQELIKQLQAGDDPRRAISQALAAAGSAISSGQSVGSGISAGVSAYHQARDNRGDRIGTLSKLADLERKDRVDPLEREGKLATIEQRRASAEASRASAGAHSARADWYRQRGVKSPEEQAAKDKKDLRAAAKDRLSAQKNIRESVAKYREELTYSGMDLEDIEGSVREFEQELRRDAGPLIGPQAAPSTAPAEEPEMHVNPETGQQIRWDGTQWVDAATGEPVQ